MNALANQLLAIANRCETERPSNELDAEIRRWLSHNDYEWWKNHAGKNNFTQSWSAARSLTDWVLITASDIAGDGLAFVVLGNPSVSPSPSVNAISSTVIGALCAASLKARVNDMLGNPVDEAKDVRSE